MPTNLTEKEILDRIMAKDSARNINLHHDEKFAAGTLPESPSTRMFKIFQDARNLSEKGASADSPEAIGLIKDFEKIINEYSDTLAPVNTLEIIKTCASPVFSYCDIIKKDIGQEALEFTIAAAEAYYQQ